MATQSQMIRRQAVEGWIFILPILIGTIVFSFFPVGYSLLASFSKWDGIHPPQFIGLQNYIKLVVGDKYFLLAVKNTFVFTFTNVPISLALGLALAILANKAARLKNLYRTAFFAPSVTSTVAIALVWGLIYSPSNGLLNDALSVFGIPGPDWLGTSRWAMTGVVIVQVWFISGYNMVIYLAGLQGISPSYYESAEIDGATPLQKLVHITIPLLSPTSFFLLITSIITSFQVFNLIYVMTQGGPGYATTVYIHYMYLNAFNYFKMGYASTMAWILFIVLAGITLFQWKMQKRWVHYE